MITKRNTKLLIQLTKVHQNYLKIKYARFELLSVALLSTVIYGPRNLKWPEGHVPLHLSLSFFITKIFLIIHQCPGSACEA